MFFVLSFMVRWRFVVASLAALHLPPHELHRPATRPQNLISKIDHTHSENTCHR